MHTIIKLGARKLPTMLGAGILSISLAGLAAAALGLTLTIGAGVVSAAIGMVVGSRYS